MKCGESSEPAFGGFSPTVMGEAVSEQYGSEFQQTEPCFDG